MAFACHVLEPPLCTSIQLKKTPRAVVSCIARQLMEGVFGAPGRSGPLEGKHEDIQEGSSGGASTLTSMRHSRSLPSLVSADLTTPRNLIEVSARMRQQHDHHDGHRCCAKASSSGKASASVSKGCPPLGKALSGKSLSGRGSALSSRASSVPSIANSRESGQSFQRQALPEHIPAC